MKLSEELASLKREIEAELDSQLSYELDFPPIIREALRYSVLNGGKRLRPILAIKTGEMFGVKQDDILPVAVSLEYIQSFTLVHDDLPCMDDAELRRGKPTLHRAYSDALAVLTGDALLNMAYGMIAKKGALAFTPERILRVIVELSDALGVDGVLGGQVLDLDPDRNMNDLNAMTVVHQMKTASFFRASLRMGAILGGAPENDLDQLTIFSEEFGLAFQITDDILDETGTVEDLGKDVRHDSKMERINYVTVHGFDGATERAREAVERAKNAIADFSDNRFLVALVDFLLERRK